MTQEAGYWDQDARCASGRILVCATAPRQTVLNFLAKLPSAQTMVLASRQNLPFFTVNGYRGIAYRGRRLCWHDLATLVSVLHHAPQTAVFVTGNTVYHENVVRAMLLWKSLRPEMELYHCANAQTPCARLGGQYFPLVFRCGLGLLSAFIAAGLWLLWGLPALAGLAAVLLCCEGMLRLRDGQNAHRTELQRANNRLSQLLRQTECRGRALFRNTRHPLLGWDNGPAQSARVRVQWTNQPGELAYVETINEQRLRITAPQDAEGTPRRPRVAVLGCSFTFGWGVNDAESYPFLLQQALQEKQVENHGVPAYSLYQMLLSLEALTACEAPHWVVIGFHEQLAERSTGTFDWLSHITGSNPPTALSISKKLLRFGPSGYRSLWLSNVLASASLLEYALNRAARMIADRPGIVRATCEHLLLEIKRLCKQHNARLVVVLVNRSASYRQFLRRHDFLVCDPEVDTVVHPERDSLLPFDPHINASAHQRIARSLCETISAIEDNRYEHPLFAESARAEKLSVFYQHF